MIQVLHARIVCYAPGDFGIMYEFSNGSIGGRSVGSLDEAIHEVARFNKGHAADVSPHSPRA